MLHTYLGITMLREKAIARHGDGNSNSLTQQPFCCVVPWIRYCSRPNEWKYYGKTVINNMTEIHFTLLVTLFYVRQNWMKSIFMWQDSFFQKGKGLYEERGRGRRERFLKNRKKKKRGVWRESREGDYRKWGMKAKRIRRESWFFSLRFASNHI